MGGDIVLVVFYGAYRHFYDCLLRKVNYKATTNGENTMVELLVQSKVRAYIKKKGLISSRARVED